MSKDWVFALDIGTRKVAGLILVPSPPGYRIRAAEVEEHGARSMFDGQIHDVPAVAALVTKIKQKLEKRARVKLDSASVAAAGRALKTSRGRAKKSISYLETITAEDLFEVKLEAIEQARLKLTESLPDHREYHCIGYTVVCSWLDGQPISNLLGQRGKTIEVEVIATFLPRVVVSSMEAVLRQAGLAIKTMTLEPIAALGVVVPPTMRQLNLALVDVGAGTSDIAVTVEGTVLGYDVVPEAGDEITEAICRELLVDFSEGEMIKRYVNHESVIGYTDVLGMKREISSSEVISLIEGAVGSLAEKIAERIVSINGGAPQAVVCVGGGSMTPGLADKIARCLEIPPSRVAVRGREAIPYVAGASRVLTGPQAVTPIGIAVTAMGDEVLGLGLATVNGIPVLTPRKRCRVADVLLNAGLTSKELFGRPGPGIGVELNGELMFLRGELGQPAPILLNGQTAGLDDIVNPGDAIEVRSPVPGRPACYKVGDLVGELTPKRVNLNGEEVVVKPVLLVDGMPASPEDELKDGAKITFRAPNTVEDVLELLEIRLGPEARVEVNGVACALSAWVAEGDKISYSTPEGEIDGEVIVNGEPVVLKFGGREVLVADLLPAIDFRTEQCSPGGRMVIEVNGREAGFSTPIRPGDKIRLAWVDETGSGAGTEVATPIRWEEKSGRGEQGDY